MSELIERAVEAAARADYESHARARIVKWDELDENWRDQSRAKVRPHVLAALGVVADHCTTEAERVEAAANGVPGAFSVAGIAARAFREVAAGLRETPE